MSAKYQLLPPLNEDEYAALFDDIASGGVKVPIDIDEHGEILDGHHRKRVCDELGIECPTRIVEIPDSAKADYALTVNLARRHLDRMQRRQLVVNSLKLDYRLGDRVHARRCGVDHKTVTSVRGDLVAVGEIPHLPEREGADGKSYPATKPPVKAPATAAKTPPVEPPKSTPIDRSGPQGAAGVADDPSRAGDGEGRSEDDRPASGSGEAKAAGPASAAGVSTPSAPKAGPEHPSPEDSGPADGRGSAGAGVSRPAPDSGLVSTPIGLMPAEFAEKLDRLAPDPNPHREWQKVFLQDVFTARRLLRKYAAEEIAEKADNQLLAEFANLAADAQDKQRDVAKAQIARVNANVYRLRSVK